MLNILIKVANQEISPIDAELKILGLSDIKDKPNWLNAIDLYVSKKYYDENKLKGIAFLNKIAKQNINDSPLRWSRDFLNQL